MKRGKAKERDREDGRGSDDEAPPNDASRVAEIDEDREARLAEMMLADLGVDRASAVTGVDTRKNTHWVDVNALDRARAANIPGTKEHEEAEKNKEGINAWQRVWVNLKDDGTHDGKYDINDGQCHREEMRRRLEQEGMIQRSHGSYNPHQNNTHKGVRGGRANAGGRGGGVIGTRVRGNAVVSSSRFIPVPPSAPSSNTRYNIRSNNSPRGRGAPLSVVVEETPSRRSQRSQPAPMNLVISSTDQAPRQRQAIAYNLGGEAGSRDAFRAAMNRHVVTPATSKPKPDTQTHGSPLRGQRASTATLSRTDNSTIQSSMSPAHCQQALQKPSSTAVHPAAATFHPSIEQPDTLFGEEIDSAPIGTRIPTPPPPATASLRSSSADSSYLNDLQGLDLSPSLRQESWGPSADQREISITAGIQAGGEHMNTSDGVARVPKEEDGATKPDTSMKVKKNGTSDATAAPPAERSRSGSPAQQSAQALLTQLLALPAIQSSPQLAQSVQAAYELLRTTQSAAGAREAPTALNPLATVATGRKSPPMIGSGQSIPIVHNRSVTSNQSAATAPSSGRINVYLPSQRTTVAVRSSGRTSSSAQDQGNPASGSAQANLRASASTPRPSPVPWARTSFAGRLQELQQTWTENIDTQLGSIAPIRGDLRDSDYSNPFFHGVLAINRLTHEQGPAIIGDHLLPAGRARTRNGSLSSSTTNISSQATIKPYEESNFRNRRSNQSSLSPKKPTGLEKAPTSRLLAQTSSRIDTDALTSPKKPTGSDKVSNSRLLAQSNSRIDTDALTSRRENLHLKDSHDYHAAKEHFKTAQTKPELRKKQSSGKIYTVSELLATKPGLGPKTKDPPRAAQPQASTNLPATIVPPTAVEPPRVTRPLKGGTLDKWLSLTSTPRSSATTPVVSSTPAAPAITITSSSPRAGSSSQASASTTTKPAAAAATSSSLAAGNAQARDAPNYPDNAITRHYAQAGQGSVSNTSTQGSAPQKSSPGSRKSALSPRAVSFALPPVSRPTTSTHNVLSGDVTASRSSGSRASTPTANNVLSGDMAASRWSDALGPALPRSSARNQQTPIAAVNPLSRVLGGDMNASRWKDDAQPTVSPNPAHIQEETAAAAERESRRGILGTSWSTVNDVEITTIPTRPRAPSNRAQSQVIGGGVGASNWNPNATSRAAASALQQDSGRSPRANALPIRAPMENIIQTDPGIGDTTELFRNYNRPHRHRLPAFLAEDSPADDPGAAVRRQYGIESSPVAENPGRENQPLGRSVAKSNSGSDVSSSRQEQGRERRL